MLEAAAAGEEIMRGAKNTPLSIRGYVVIAVNKWPWISATRNSQVNIGKLASQFTITYSFSTTQCAFFIMHP